jgi:hypothetical protein
LSPDEGDCRRYGREVSAEEKKRVDHLFEGFVRAVIGLRVRSCGAVTAFASILVAPILRMLAM